QQPRSSSPSSSVAVPRPGQTLPAHPDAARDLAAVCRCLGELGASAFTSASQQPALRGAAPPYWSSPATTTAAAVAARDKGKIAAAAAAAAGGGGEDVATQQHGVALVA
ncbi:unnamed protein product, partial [Ectocarpus fasciculatus]